MTSFIDVALVVGARPNFVKAAALLAEMRNHAEFRPRLIHTGQHYDDRMSGQFFTELEIPAPDVNLGVNAGSVVAQIAEIMTRLSSVLTDARRFRLWRLKRVGDDVELVYGRSGVSPPITGSR